MAAVIDVQRAEELLRGVALPPQPELLVAAEELLGRPDPDPAAVARLIGADVALSGAVLRVVNSPLFGLPVKVQGIPHAVMVLGTRQTLNVVRGVALRRALDSRVRVPMPRFWDEASQVALVAAAVARRATRVPPDEAYTLGLFHDCGIPLLAQRFPNYKKVLAEANGNPDERFTDIEERYFQTHHAVVGYFVAQGWYLAKPLRDAILAHHRVDEVITVDTPSGREMETRLAVLAVAEHVETLARNCPRQREWAAVQPAVADYLGLSGPDFDDLTADLLENLQTG